MESKWETYEYEISFDKQGGSGGTDSVKITYGTKPANVTIPTKTGNTFLGYYTGKNGEGEKYYNSEGEALIEYNKEEGITLYAYWVQSLYTFAYKGSEYEFIVPATGTYKIELWGAQGGDSSSSLYVGGKGAYTKGEIALTKGTSLYVYVGQSGASIVTEGYNSRYNGGAGIGYRPSLNTGNGGTGGGATDVRLTGGEWDNFESLKSRIMVAGGGGGGANRGGNNGDGSGGAGGELVGLTGENVNNSAMTYGYGTATGGTQTSAGITTWHKGTSMSEPENYNPEIIVGGFGYAGIIWGISCVLDCQPRNNLTWAPWPNHCGGGGGWYGGASNLHGGAGGGSSYISGHPGCKAISSTSTEDNIIHLDTPNHYSGKVFTETEMIAGNKSMPKPDGGTEVGHTGNGYARITLIK